MQRIPLLFFIGLLLFSSLAFALETYPQDFKGLGGCTDKESCYRFCQEHPDDCKNFRMPLQQPASPLSMMPQGQGMMLPFSKMDPVEMAMHDVFTQAKHMDTMAFKQYCPDAEKMVDTAIAQMKDQGIELKLRCDEMQKMLHYCKGKEQENRCENYKTNPPMNKDFLRCSTSQEQYFKECMNGYKQNDEITHAEDICTREFTAFQPSCTNVQNRPCDEAVFLQQCQTEREQYCHTLPREQQESCLQTNECSTRWEAYRVQCQQFDERCNRERFMTTCKERMNKNLGQANDQRERQCKEQSVQLYQHMLENCRTKDAMYQKCLEEKGKQCSRMEEAAAKCSSITPEQIRARMIERGKMMCDAMRYKTEGEGMESVMAKMMQMREQLPEDKRFVMENEMERLNTVHKETRIEEQQENVFTKFMRFLGFFKQKEMEEAGKLRDNAAKIDESIRSLTVLRDQMMDDTTKQILSEQISKLEAEKQKIEQLATSKTESVSVSGMFVNFFQPS